ncbi:MULTISPECIES: ABC transporter ATP-binding protein [Gammaproteobacteria]|uniref:ABC transporter ATP-binding protein n=1 Tax=Gammaproteobacteria TaxID=1236 RepID=UPI00097EF813|nr:MULTISPECIES: ABC transporter ATP-binding protein [Gammaproteobacteria]WKD26347.1 ABC transporter ATP-binding protein/permease [Pseudoalteromonas sp. KG3]SJN30735.1 ABC transporter ATP-binding protein [Vibrio casei]
MLNQIMRLSGCSMVTIGKNIAVAIADAVTMIVPNFFVFFILAEMLDPTPSENYLIFYCVLIVGCLFARLIAVKLTFTAHSEFSSRSGYEMRKDMMKKLTRIPLGSLLSMDLGTLNNTLLKDVEFTEHTLSHVISYVLGIACVLVLLMIGLFMFDWRLALSMLIGFPVAIAMFVFLSRLSQEGKDKLFRTADKLSSAIFEYILGIRVLRAHGQADGEFLELDEKMKSARDAHLKYEMRASLAPAAFIIFSEAGFASLIMFGLYSIGTETLSITIFLLFLLVSMQFYRPLTQLAILLTQFQYFKVSMSRIEGVLEQEELIEETECVPENVGHEVSFNNVNFRYKETPLFNRMNITFPEHSVTAIVGPSGSGKSTMMSLIARFWDTEEGAITIGGKNVKNMSQTEISEHISMVFQEVYLFDDTIYNNVVMGQEVSPTKLEQVCRQAQCWEFIHRFSDGLQTVVGEGGMRLSGGEKQRISIARALLKDAPIVLLDEATVALDVENEALIQRAISSLVKDKTVILVAHNLLNVIHADQIVVLEYGEIGAVGNHEQLIKSSDAYQTLWNDQLESQGWKA